MIGNPDAKPRQLTQSHAIWRITGSLPRFSYLCRRPFSLSWFIQSRRYPSTKSGSSAAHDIQQDFVCNSADELFAGFVRMQVEFTGILEPPHDVDDALLHLFHSR